jgi:hypothetical protein
MEPTKVCSRCAETKPVVAFSPSTDGRVHPDCRPCRALTERERRASLSPSLAVERRARRQARRYGLTLADIEQMMQDQGGTCALCPSTGPFDIDHDHATDRVRGLLCRSCNLLIGLSGDDPEHLMRAIAYLQAVKV